MKVLSREFTLMEKILIIALCLILVGLAYYQFVDKPVRKNIAAAKAEQESLDMELTTLQTRLDKMHKMQNEVDDIIADGNASEMASYNNSPAELKILSDIFRQAQRCNYSTNPKVTRSGDQIRRTFTIQFTAKDFKSAQSMLKQLAENHFRVLIGDISFSGVSNGVMNKDQVTVNATATFYETMVGGVADDGLPVSEAAAN